MGLIILHWTAILGEKRFKINLYYRKNSLKNKMKIIQNLQNYRVETEYFLNLRFLKVNISVIKKTSKKYIKIADRKKFSR